MVVKKCLSSMHPTTQEILKDIRIIGLLPAQSHGNSYIFYDVANSYKFVRPHSYKFIRLLLNVRILRVANSALLPDVTERCYQVNVIYQISLI